MQNENIFIQNLKWNKYEWIKMKFIFKIEKYTKYIIQNEHTDMSKNNE